MMYFMLGLLVGASPLLFTLLVVGFLHCEEDLHLGPGISKSISKWWDDRSRITWAGRKR
jgi:hypothetical protein